MTDSEVLKALYDEVIQLKDKINNLDSKMNNIESHVNNLETKVNQNTLVVESTVNHCLKVLGEGYQLNAERFDNLNIESIKQNSDITATMIKILDDKINLLKQQLTA